MIETLESWIFLRWRLSYSEIVKQEQTYCVVPSDRARRLVRIGSAPAIEIITRRRLLGVHLSKLHRATNVKETTTMTDSNQCIDKLFRNARTHSAWIDKPILDEALRELYDATKWGPTSANGSPARFVFIRSAAAKERLRPSLAPGNVEKTMTAPVCVIVAYDLQFYEQLPSLFPHNPGMRDLFAANAALVEVTARRNSSLQGAYMMLAARALGLDCGPMSGFDNAKLDEEFFGAGKESDGCEQEFFPAGHVKSNFLCNLGYGDPSKLFPRSPRLEFNQACTLM